MSCPLTGRDGARLETDGSQRKPRRRRSWGLDFVLIRTNMGDGPVLILRGYSRSASLLRLDGRNLSRDGGCHGELRFPPSCLPRQERLHTSHTPPRSVSPANGTQAVDTRCQPRARHTGDIACIGPGSACPGKPAPLLLPHSNCAAGSAVRMPCACGLEMRGSAAGSFFTPASDARDIHPRFPHQTRLGDSQ